MHLFDTHTHFDVADFDEDRQQLALEAKKVGVDALVLIGFLQSRFDELVHTHHQLKQWENVPTSYLAPGLHPFYIEQHKPEYLSHLEQILQQEDNAEQRKVRRNRRNRLRYLLKGTQAARYICQAKTVFC